MKLFSEGTVPGKRYGKISHSFKIDKLIFKGKSPYQDILIFDNSVYGRVFVLDGIVQLSQSDEHIYHEMLVHPVLLAHPRPLKILIIGGGDGGALRECLKHNPKQVILVDIDKKVIQLAKKYLSFVSQGAFSDKRVKIFNEDGKDFIKQYRDYFDIVIIDGEDPVGTSVPLYAYNFYKDIQRCLKKDGMAVFQVGSFLDKPLLKSTYSKLKRAFAFVSRFRLTMPSYHCGEYCFMAASKKINFNKLNFKLIEKRFKKLETRHKFKYYSLLIHQASQIIPPVFLR